MEVIIQIIIGLSIFELLYWLISEFLLSIREKTKLDQEAQDYLEQQIKSQNDSEESLKNKKE
jgi:uncharacterized membrane protein